MINHFHQNMENFTFCFVFATFNFLLNVTLCHQDLVYHGRDGQSAMDIFNRRKLSVIHNDPEHAKLHPEINFERVSPNDPGPYLYALLLRNYSYHILPVTNSQQHVTIRLLLKLTQIVEIDEKSQILTTNVWLRHEWYDANMRWDPQKFGGITSFYVPADELWLPDTVLYNNADGDYQITIHTKAQVRYDGLVVWEPPAIYKSFCHIDVEFFPYDMQLCEMKFGPWTYDVSKVDYVLLNPDGTVSTDQHTTADMTGFYESVEWDVMEVTGSRKVFQYPCCQEQYVDVTYDIHIRRKTLFYTINLIIPCVMIALVTVLVFYLPSKSSEKMAFSISTLLSLTWFILLLSEIIPPTSLSLPLMGKYLLFTMILVTMSIAATVLVLYQHCRHPFASKMPYWVRYVFLDVLPMLLWFQTTIFAKKQHDDEEQQEDIDFDMTSSSTSSRTSTDASSSPEWNQTTQTIWRWSLTMASQSEKPEMIWVPPAELSQIPQQARARKKLRFAQQKDNKSHNNNSMPKIINKSARKTSKNQQYSKILLDRMSSLKYVDGALQTLGAYMQLPEVQEAAQAVQFISRHFHKTTSDARLKDDWEAVSRVLDRLFLIVFCFASTLGTLAILLRSPSLYDTTPALHMANHEIVISATTEPTRSLLAQ